MFDPEMSDERIIIKIIRFEGGHSYCSPLIAIHRLYLYGEKNKIYDSLQKKKKNV